MNNLAVRMAMLFCLTVAVVLTGSAQTGFYTLNGGTEDFVATKKFILMK